MQYSKLVKTIKKYIITDFLNPNWNCFEVFLKTLHEMILETSVFLDGVNNEIYQQGIKIIIFGAGDAGQRLLQTYRENNIDVIYFCDNDKNKHHTFIDGVFVIAPEEISNTSQARVVVASLYGDEISRQLKMLHIPHIVVDVALLHAGHIIDQSFFTLWVERVDFYLGHLNAIYQVYLLLEDERSQLIYLNILKARMVEVLKLDGDIYSKICEGNEYWALSEFRNIADEIYVDAGACVGDTIEKFLYNTGGDFKKIYAFEASPQIFEILRIKVSEIVDLFGVDEESIECIPEGVGSEEKNLILHCSTTNCGSNTFSDEILQRQGNKITWQFTEQIKVCRLDKYLKDVPVSFIKADIEGSELDMLKGGSELIKRFRPKIAICLYHKLEDLFEIPLYIKSLVPEYKMAIRHHSGLYTETVLYCWI
jgi:FkbM family methyltransferase